MSSMATGRPRPTSDEQRSLAAFGELLASVHDEVDRAVVAAAAKIDGFAAVLASQDPDEAARESERSRALERGALLDGAWDDYLANLSEQGAGYAQMGIRFGDWYGLLRPYREVVVEAALREGVDAARLRLVLDGLGHFLDIAMATLAEAYLAARDALVREKERELFQYVRALERSNAELDDFAYVASHDLKAPLRDIQTLAEWVVEDGSEALPEPSAKHLRLIGARIARMERLLDDLLAYSRAARASGEPETIDVRQAIHEVAAVALPPSGFALSVSGPALTLHAARAPFETVLRNLMSNAVKHHHSGEGKIDVDIVDLGDTVDVAVTDDGPGIPETFHDRVFRMFQTLRPRDEIEGSGMGLATVKKIVESRGGTIALESTEGRGTTVRFTWPKRDATEAP